MKIFRENLPDELGNILCYLQFFQPRQILRMLITLLAVVENHGLYLKAAAFQRSIESQVIKKLYEEALGTPLSEKPLNKNNFLHDYARVCKFGGRLFAEGPIILLESIVVGILLPGYFEENLGGIIPKYLLIWRGAVSIKKCELR